MLLSCEWLEGAEEVASDWELEVALCVADWKLEAVLCETAVLGFTDGELEGAAEVTVDWELEDPIVL